VDPVTPSVVISRPPQEVFEYLADIANLPEFCDHFTSKWHLTREESWGKGAGARFMVDQRFNRFSGHDLTYIEVQEPGLIVMAGRAGKFNRIRVLSKFELDPVEGGRATRVRFSYEMQAKVPSDRLFERRRFFKRGWGKALKRLRDVLEEDYGRGKRATIAGGARKPATGSPLR
jgi:uncharacterized protein YndB with AHSA1/START domain